MLADVINQSPLGVVHLIASDHRLVARRADSRRPLTAALPREGCARIEFGDGVQVIGIELAGNDGQARLTVDDKHRVGPDCGRDLLGLTLLDQAPRGPQGVVMLNRQLNGLIEVNTHGRSRLLPGGRGS